MIDKAQQMETLDIDKERWKEDFDLTVLKDQNDANVSKVSIPADKYRKMSAYSTKDRSQPLLQSPEKKPLL